MDDLLPGELESAATNMQGEDFIGYGYAVGEVPTPSPTQHAELIALSRKLGRFLDEAEVRSVLCADAAKLMLVTRPAAALLAQELPNTEYVGARKIESQPAETLVPQPDSEATGG